MFHVVCINQHFPAMLRMVIRHHTDRMVFVQEMGVKRIAMVES